MLHGLKVPRSVPGLAHTDDCRFSDESASVRPPEILCQILQFAVGPNGGVKALLPLTRVSAQWRRAALGDSSLWTTIHLRQTTDPLLDMILARAGNRLFTVYVDDHDLDRLAKLWELFDRVEELHYTHDGIEELTPFITSLGPAPNLKALYLQPGSATRHITAVNKLPVIFSGCLPLLRTIAFSNTIAWPPGLFRDLVSFECGASKHHPISASHALDAIRGSPSIKFICLVGISRVPKGFDPPVVDFPSLENCTLSGNGTNSLIRFIIAPMTSIVSLSRSHTGEESFYPNFNECSVMPGIRLLDELSALSLSISDYAAQLQARNDHGGVLDVKVDELYHLSKNPIKFIDTIWDSFQCWHSCPGFKTAKRFTLRIERGRIWQPGEADLFSVNVLGLMRNLPGVKAVDFHGVPPRELANLLVLLSSPPEDKFPCPNLSRLHVESTILRSPEPLLVALDRFLTSRKSAGVPLQYVTIKVRCETLVPAADHCAFLAAWEGVVEESVRVEYERAEVERLPGCRRYDCGCGDNEDENEGADIRDAGDHCVGWDGWPEKWPETTQEANRQQAGSA